MPRTKPTESVDVIGKLEKGPENAVRDFYASRVGNDNFRKLPTENGLTDTYELIYVQCVREHDTLMDIQKDIIKEKKWNDVLNKRRENYMYNSQNELRKRFIAVTKTLNEFKDKYIQAVSTMSTETEKQDTLIQRIEDKKVEFGIISQFRDEFNETVMRYGCYEELLQNFVKENKVYSSVDDFISRTDAIMFAFTEISSMNIALSNHIDDLQKELVTITRDIAATVIHTKNELDFFARAYTLQITECKELESNLHKIKEMCLKVEVERHRLLEGIYNIYSLLRKRSKKENVFRFHDVEEICGYIKKEAEVLKSVIKILERKRSRQKIGKNKILE